MARDFLILARERVKLDLNQRAGELSATVVEAGEDRLLPAEVSLIFDSPLRSGTVLLWLDGEELPPVKFGFAKKRKGGRVEHQFLVPPGEHALTVELVTSGDSRGSFTFEREINPDSRWTLRLNMPSETAQCSAFLVPRKG